MYSFFWVIPLCLNFMCRRSETSAHKNQTTGNHSKERIEHAKHSERLKSTCRYFTKKKMYFQSTDIIPTS